MINTLIERDLHALSRRKKALKEVNPILNKLQNAVMQSSTVNIIDKPEGKVTWDNIVRKYIEVDVWDWCALIVLNTLPTENKELFDDFKKIFAEYGVKSYKKDNDAEMKKRKLKAQFSIFNYKSFGGKYDNEYKIDIIFRGKLPAHCRLEYEESYEEVDSDSFIVQNGRVMRKERTAKVICEEQSILRLPKANV